MSVAWAPSSAVPRVSQGTLTKGTQDGPRGAVVMIPSLPAHPSVSDSSIPDLLMSTVTRVTA